MYNNILTVYEYFTYLSVLTMSNHTTLPYVFYLTVQQALSSWIHRKLPCRSLTDLRYLATSRPPLDLCYQDLKRYSSERSDQVL